MHLPVAFDVEVNAGAALLELLAVDPSPPLRQGWEQLAGYAGPSPNPSLRG